MKLWFAALLAAACGSTKSPEPSCGARVKLVRVEARRVVLEFDNVSTETIHIGSSPEAAFVDTDGNAMSAVSDPGSNNWFLSFSLPAGSHREVAVALGTSGDPARLDRIEVPDSGPEPSFCTIRASGLAADAPHQPVRSQGKTDALDKMVGFKNAMCRCTDTACANKVNDEMTKWSHGIAEEAHGDLDDSEADRKLWQSAIDEFSKCALTAFGVKGQAPPS